SPIQSPDPFPFFFSSRRRHTRFSRDWSSDVCSSDLGDPAAPDDGDGARLVEVVDAPNRDGEDGFTRESAEPVPEHWPAERRRDQIGRASRRQSACSWADGVLLLKLSYAAAALSAGVD